MRLYIGWFYADADLLPHTLPWGVVVLRPLPLPCTQWTQQVRNHHP